MFIDFTREVELSVFLWKNKNDRKGLKILGDMMSK